jgi:hypothetical protein
VTALTGEPVPPRRLAGWALVGGLCLAAAVAIFALVTGSFDDTDWRIIASSLGFSVLSATAAAGEALRREGRGARMLVGAAAVASSAVAYVLLLGGLWIDDDADRVWRACGCFGLLALAGSHASLVLRSVRSSDTGVVRTLCDISIVTGAIDTTAGVLGLSGAIDDVDEGVVTALAVLVVILLLTTALPPILRRLQAGRPAPRVVLSAGGRAAERLEEIAARLGPDMRSEAEDLRRIARELER